MLNRFAAGLVLGLLCPAEASAQQPAQPARPPATRPAAEPARLTIGALLNAGFELKTVLTAPAPCGNQPATRAQTCNHEIYFLQSSQKNILYRCEIGNWNGAPVTQCIEVR